MAFTIKPIMTESETAGKAYVHYTAWLETYPGIMPREYLEKRSLRKCEETARAYPENTLTALDGDRVIGFLSYAPQARDFVSVRPSSEIVALYVLKGNEGAIGFYRHKGFRFTGGELTQAVTGGELTELEMVLER